MKSASLLASTLLIAVHCGAAALAAGLEPTPLAGLRFTNDFFPGSTYRAAVPKGEDLLGFGPGERAANAGEIERCLKAWSAAAPESTRLVEYGRTYEQRPLYYLVVSAPENISRVEEIQAGMTKLGDPRKLSDEEAKKLVGELPPVAWLAYTIHGDETEGSDAALALLYHLIAAEDSKVRQLLRDIVVIVDPLMNPDGRDRFLKMVAEHRGAMPNVDDQSLLHTGYLPWGRGNHYYFDLNRDWIYGVHPETRGRIREISRWNPVLMVDAHGMGPQETHLFSPPREPINIHIPATRERWGRVFARDQARALDQHGLLYYHGEWNEDWYPGYSDSWPVYRGAVGILYEQARIAEDGVRRPEGRILSYRESVFHHVLGSMANLSTLQAHRRELLENFCQVRKSACDAKGAYGSRTFAVLPNTNRGRLERFARLIQLQGLELYQATNEISAQLATDQLGREWRNQTLPAGTLLIPNRQPLGHLAAALLDFDPRIPARVLEEERQDLLRKGESRIYDVTAWNLTMMFGLEALILPTDLPGSVPAYAAPAAAPAGIQGPADSAVAYVINGADDRSVTAAARLLERGVQARVAEKPFRFDDRDFPRGSVVITRLDNRNPPEFRQLLDQTLGELGLSAAAITTGYADGDLPNLGGGYFQRLEPPRVALFSRGRCSPGDFGQIWFLLDDRLGIRHSHLDMDGGAELSRYNVLIVPERFGGPIPDEWMRRLKTWVEQGGTLIAIGNSAAHIADPKSGLGSVRQLQDVFGKLEDYELAVWREWLGRSGDLPALDSIWTHRAEPGLKYPWQALEGGHPEEKELKKRDAWQRLFMPQGAIVASRTDTNHWLTFGCPEPFPVLVSRDPILMVAEGARAPVRLGYLIPTGAGLEPRKADGEASETKAKSEGSPDKKGKDRDKQETPRIGWAALPPGTEMHLRMSGLLWPEASQRLANAAYVTREGVGRGQVILFAADPAFRAASLGTMRLLANAIVFGPGCGAAHPVRP
jgi:hypothetical protein